jgi:AAA lid domain
LFDYLKWLEIRPDMQIDNESSRPKIEWDYSKDDEEALRYIIKLADLLAPLRGVSHTWETRGSQGSDYGYTIPIVEDPTRATTQLYNLARGHAFSRGRNYVLKEDLSLVIKVVLSTGPVERVRILDKILVNNGKLSTNQITAALSMAPKTAKRNMLELTLLGLVDIYPKIGTEDAPEHQGAEKVITLKPQFMEWLDTEEFKTLRKGFVPTDNSEYLKEGEGEGEA